VKILSFGSRIIQDATKEQRSNQWDVLRNPTASVEDVLAELGNFEEYTVQKGRTMSDTKSAIADIKLGLVDAKDDEQRLALYKEGFTLLSAMLG
jgi:hypothetical protein